MLLGLNNGEPPVKLYFDKASGLLMRMVHYADTPLGLNPTQVDFADYREVNGVKTPYRWTIARPSGAFTIQIDKVEQNVPIDSEQVYGAAGHTAAARLAAWAWAPSYAGWAASASGLCATGRRTPTVGNNVVGRAGGCESF